MSNQKRAEYNGTYVGIVVDNKDDSKIGRLKITVPYIFDGIKTEDLPWAEPCFPYGGIENQGMFFIPEIDSYVIVQFVNGSPYKPIWLGTYHRQYNNENYPPEEAIRNNYQYRKIIKTKVGYILYDDKDDELIIVHKKGHHMVFNEKLISIAHECGSFISLEDDGNIYIQSKNNIHENLPRIQYIPKVLKEKKYEPPKRKKT